MITKLKCKWCGRHLGEVEVLVGELPCSNSSCKGTTQFKIVSQDNSKLFTYKFDHVEKQPKKKEEK